MLSVAEARARMLAGARPLPGEEVPLVKAGGRVLLSPLIAKITQPPLPLSAMDGYAVRAADCHALPARLSLTASIAAGQVAAAPLGFAEAHRIFTGAPLPLGADAIVIQEDAEQEGDVVILRDKVEPGRHIRQKGADFSAGDTLLSPPLVLTGRHIALAAAAGHGRLVVSRRPEVAVLSTGDELVVAGEKLGPAQIAASTGPGLMTLLSTWGAQAHDLGIARDNRADLSAALPPPGRFDLLITLGGASVGAHDLVKDTLAGQGFTLDFWKIAVQPGKPLLFGDLSGMPVIGLPGNPVSALVCALLFVRPVLERMLGLPGDPPATVPAVLLRDLPANGGREHYMRARCDIGADGQRTVMPDPCQDSSLLTVLAHANALLVRPPLAPAARSGDIVRVVPLE